MVLVLLFAGMAGIIQTKKRLRNQIHTQSYTQIRTVKRVRERDGAYEPNHESRRIKTNKSTENTERFFYVKLCYMKLSLGLYELVRSIYFLCWFVRFLVCVVVWFFLRCILPCPFGSGKRQVNFSPLICIYVWWNSLFVTLFFRTTYFVCSKLRLPFALGFSVVFICPFDQFVTYDCSPSTILDAQNLCVVWMQWSAYLFCIFGTTIFVHVLVFQYFA